MKDAEFRAELKSAKLTFREVEGNPIRRVEFSLCCEFTVEAAEWLGAVALNQRDLMVNGDVEKFTADISAYHAKASLSGTGGNVELEPDGILASATTKAGKGEDGEPTYWVTFTFEAYPHASLLTFLAACLKEYIDCDFKRVQLECA